MIEARTGIGRGGRIAKDGIGLIDGGTGVVLSHQRRSVRGDIDGDMTPGGTDEIATMTSAGIRDGVGLLEMNGVVIPAAGGTSIDLLRARVPIRLNFLKDGDVHMTTTIAHTATANDYKIRTLPPKTTQIPSKT